MACRKYTLTNNTATTQVYSYQECNNLMWNYDFVVEAGQIKNVWAINGTFTVPQTSMLSVVDDGVFPPASTLTPSVTPSMTPTPSVTSSMTPTPSVTPSITPTMTLTSSITPTPTNIIRTRLENVCHDEADPVAICGCPGFATLFVNGTNLSDSTLVWSDEAGVNTGNPEGYYLENNIIYEVSTGCGPGCITGSTISVYGNCPTVTPTPTVTQTSTPTPTPTPSSTPPIQGFFFTLQEVGPDVVLSGTGSVDLSSLTPALYSAGSSFINPSQGLFCVGSSINEEVYTGASLGTPPSFGSGNLTTADSVTGDNFGTDGFGGIKVPQGYSGGVLNGTSTFTGTTLSTLGAVVGTYITQWGSSGATETLTLDVV